MLERIIQLQAKARTPVKINRSAESMTTVTPYAQALTLHFPFGAFVWNRPIAVEFDDGQTSQRVQIMDMTRILQLGMYGLSILFLGATIFNLISKRKA